MPFTLIDLFIVIAVIFAISSGYRRGFWLSMAQYVGLVLGVIIGAALAPVVMDVLNLSGSTARSLGAVMILIVLGTIGSSVGYWVGEPIRLLRTGASGPIPSAVAQLDQYARRPGGSDGDPENPGIWVRRDRLRQRFPGRSQHGADQRPCGGWHSGDDGPEQRGPELERAGRVIRPRSRRRHPLRAPAGAGPAQRGRSRARDAGCRHRLSRRRR